jgi:hypothetical protein
MGGALMWQTERARSIRAHREVGAAIWFARENRGWRLADLAVRTGSQAPRPPRQSAT